MLLNKSVRRYYGKYWYCFVFGILALLLVDVIQLFFPEIIGSIVTNINEGTLTMNYLWLQVLYIFLCGIGIFGGRVGWRYLINGVSHRIEADLRRRLFVHLELMSKEYHNSHKTGATMALLTNDVESVGYTFSDGIIFFIDFFVLGALAMIKMLMMNWLLSIVTIVPLVFLILSGHVFEKKETDTYEKLQESFENLSDFTNENLSGIAVIKAFIKERQQIRAFGLRADDNRAKYMHFIRIDNAYNIMINGLIYVSYVGLFILGSHLVVSNANIPLTTKMDGGALTTFYGYFDTLIWPMLALVFWISTMSRGKASVKRIEELLDTPVEVKDSEDVELSDEMKGSISIKNLTFHYPGDEKAALNDCSVEIKAGENIGIIGRTGSGKTTFVNMLLKLYNIPDGKIFIDGKDINTWQSKQLRDSIGYVGQDTFLFSSTIADNIAFANPKFDRKRIERAAKFACVDDNIREFKDGYDTVIGERGVTLSGGQKQRISMARAIAKNPQILILDDSVSAVDSSTEKEILANIKKERKGKTTLIIAHRISAVEELDHIILLDEGKIIGFGTHEELLASSKEYQNIVKLQELEKEVK